MSVMVLVIAAIVYYMCCVVALCASKCDSLKYITSLSSLCLASSNVPL
jgi:hypothetical protein